MTGSNASGSSRKATADDVGRLCRDISDARMAAILATGASLSELEAAVAWADRESDVMGDARRPLEGRVAQIHEILTEGEDLWEEGEAP